MDGKAPDVVYAEQNAGKRPVLDEVLDFACMPRFCPVSRSKGGVEQRGVLVGKQGVTYQGLYFGAFNADVQRLHGQRVQLAVNNDDLSSVLVLRPGRAADLPRQGKPQARLERRRPRTWRGGGREEEAAQDAQGVRRPAAADGRRRAGS
jgi:hypothetical protein